MSPSMEKERIDHQVLNSIFSGTEPDRNTLAKYQIRLAAFFGISVYKRLERCVGTHPEKLWVKIPNYFCLSAYRGNDGGEGREEYGGVDVRDVLNLIPLARALGYIDMHNVFMLG